MRAYPVDVVLPCLDEAEALPWVLSRLPPGYRAVVADNGSTDGSAELARAYGARVVEVARRGYGAACHAGVAASGTDVVAVLDADASLDPLDLPPVVEPVVSGDADLVLGWRVPHRGAFPLHARVGNLAFAAALRVRAGVRLRDIGPMRAFRRNDLLALRLRDRRYGYPLETVLRAAEAGWRIRETPVPYRRRTGRSKVTGTLRGTVRAVHDMSRVLAR